MDGAYIVNYLQCLHTQRTAETKIPCKQNTAEKTNGENSACSKSGLTPKKGSSAATAIKTVNIFVVYRPLAYLISFFEDLFIVIIFVLVFRKQMVSVEIRHLK